MAMARSLAPLLLLSVLVSGAAAARTVGDSVQDACSKSQFPKVCADGLSAKPEAQKATPRGLAELFVGFAAEKGSWMATFLHGKFNSGKDSTMLDCYDSCGEDIEEAMAHLNGLIREPTDAKLLELKSWLSSTVGSGTSACEEACKDAPKTSDKDDVVNKSFEFEKLLRVTLDLITEASGSMSADIALPPSDAAAPSSGASGPSADSPAAGADAPSGASSSAPSPSGSSAADAPSGDSDAPAPSSDASADDDNDDDDDDTKA
uniref:Pectinesterase inhibitor domain-containing protein n=1 Tax=Setaria italica TaxID=4555 RepID=K3ZW70_SETIT